MKNPSSGELDKDLGDESAGSAARAQGWHLSNWISAWFSHNWVLVLVATVIVIAGAIVVATIVFPTLHAKAQIVRRSMTVAEVERILGPRDAVTLVSETPKKAEFRWKWRSVDGDVEVYFAQHDSDPPIVTFVSPSEKVHPRWSWVIRRWLEEHVTSLFRRSTQSN